MNNNKTKADLLYTNANIMTLDAANSSADTLAVAGGRVLAVGKAHALEGLTGSDTKRVSLSGRFVMPGLIESHTHALWGAMRDLFEVYVGYTATTQQLGDAIAKRAGEVAPGTWIKGGPWRPQMRAELGATPRAWLDAIAPDHPVVFYDTSQHAAWVNSKALELAGLNDGCADIEGGVIERNSNGALTGFLAEAAVAPVRKCTTATPEQFAAACDYVVTYFNRLGYTGFKEPMADEATLATYATAIDERRFSLHAAAHISAFSPLTDGMVDVAFMQRLRQTYARDDLKLDFAKLFLDGVAPAYTASYISSYRASDAYDPAKHDPDATLLIKPDVLNAKLIELDALGYVVKMHAVGDNAVRKGLDSIEAARKANGNSGLRHEIAHTAYVTDEDLPRFKQLDAIAEVSPKLWMPNAATPAQHAVLHPEQMARLHRIKDLHNAGAEIIFGTDWPASAPDANPWNGLSGMLDRRDATGIHEGALNPQQAIDLATALPIFTTNAARAMGREGEVGALKPGAWADFITLERDIREMTPQEIGAIEVRQTVWKGDVVFEG